MAKSTTGAFFACSYQSLPHLYLVTSTKTATKRANAKTSKQGEWHTGSDVQVAGQTRRQGGQAQACPFSIQSFRTGQDERVEGE